MITFPIFLALLIGSGMLLVSLHLGMQFYPPGYYYAEEKRNNRWSTFLGLVGLALLISGSAAAIAQHDGEGNRSSQATEGGRQ